MANLTPEQMAKRIAELEAVVAAQNKPREITFKIGEKGGISAYGLGRFPVTLYFEQWERLLAAADRLKAFIAEGRKTGLLKTKAEAQALTVPASK
jgi:hypothetical protein